MFVKNKKMLLITSLLTLLPIPVGLVLMNRFPDTMAIHWGITGQADGFASPITAIILISVLANPVGVEVLKCFPIPARL